MTVPTAQELQLLQRTPHNTKLFLSIYQPNTVLACQLNGSGTKGMTTINYDNVIQGSPALVESEVYTMLVGLTPGGDEKGRIRVRSATGGLSTGTLSVPINSHINWEENDYLTVLRHVEINPVYQRIIQDPGDPMNTLWYKFSDVAYTNQNSVLGSLVCMGSHYAGFLENGQCQVFYSASGTHNLKNEAMMFNWFFQGASTTGSSAHTPGYITYTTPGHYMTRLTVTTSGTASDVSYRFISIYDKPGQGASTPILKWELTDLSGHREAGGYHGTIRVRDLVYKNIIRDNALVVIFAEDWYGDTKQSIGGNDINRSTIFFVGYILNGTIQYNYQDGYIDFEIVSPTEVMKSMEGYAIDVTSSTDPAGQAASDPNYPSGWTLLLEMDVRRAIYHYLRWHSTVLFCTDFNVKHFGQDLAIEHFTSDRTSIYDAINTLIQTALYGEIVADRQGKIFAEVATYATNNASGSFPTALLLDKSKWIGDPNIEERQVPQTSFIELGGIAYAGPSIRSSAAFLSNAPGSEPGQRGKMEQKQGLALSDQSQLNTLAGNIYAWKNSRYPNVSYNLAGNYRNLDIAPQELVYVTIQQPDTPRGISFTNKPFAVRGMSWGFDSKQELLLPQLSVSEITQGFVGDTIEIPPIPPVQGDNGGGFQVPPIAIPPFSIPVVIRPFYGVKINDGQGHIVDTDKIYWEITDTSNPILIYNPNGMFDPTESRTQFRAKATGYYFMSLTVGIQMVMVDESQFARVLLADVFITNETNAQTIQSPSTGILSHCIRVSPATFDFNVHFLHSSGLLYCSYDDIIQCRTVVSILTNCTLAAIVPYFSAVLVS